MKRTWKIISASAVLTALIIGAFAFCSRSAPRRTMRELAPADAAVYLETSDLRKIFQNITENETWRKLAPQFSIDFQTNAAESFLSPIFASDTLKIAERGQFAVVLDDFEAVEREDSLNLKPRLTIIADTHLSESANISEFEKLLTKYVGGIFQNAEKTRTESDGFKWTVWREQNGERRIFLAARQSLVYIGNDERAIKKCLAAGQGETPNLLQNEELKDLLDEMNAADSTAFGYISPNGVKQISEVLTVAYVGKAVEEETAMRVLAETAPKVARNFARSVGWTIRRTADKRFEERFFIRNAPELNSNLREPLQTSVDVASELVRFVPSESVRFSFYNVQNPQTAWNGLVRETARPLDAISAIFVTQNAKILLEPYGIVQPNEFLSAVGNEILTLQTEDGSQSSAAVFRARNVEKLRAEIFKRLETNAPKREKIGEYEMLSGEEDFSAAFVGNFLVAGESSAVKKCVQTFAANGSARNLEKISIQENDSVPFARTYETDENALEFVRVFASDEANQKKIQAENRFAVTETSWRRGGFERRTVSDFGTLGKIIVGLSGN